MKKINCYANDEDLTIVNAIDEDFDIHRIFEIIDEKKDENFTADNAAKEKINKTIVINDEINETVKEKKINQTNVNRYLTKIS